MSDVSLRLAVIALAACAHAAPASTAITRDDLMVESEPGVAVSVRRVARTADSDGVPVVLVHGAGGGGVASFDVPVPGYSLAEDLARADHPTYLIDIRGWGRSTRPAALDAPPEANPPAVRSDAAMIDLAAVVAQVRAREHRRVALVGAATGGHWAGMFAATHPDDVSHLVMVNSLYGTPGEWSMRARLEDADHPGQPSLGAYTARDARSLLRTWDTTIPVADKARWRDPRVAAAYVELTLAGAPTAHIPAGALYDSYLLSTGTPLWHATDVRAATLVVRGGLDFWSRPEDLAALRHDLVHARRVQVVEIPDATHFFYLDRPEHGRARFVDTLVQFLAAP